MDADMAGGAPSTGAPAGAADTSLASDLELVRALAGAVQRAGGRALVVGGYARDEALRRLGRPAASKDVDVEVFGLSFEELRPLLAAAGGADVVGAAFQVAKVRHTSIDVSIPRRHSRGGAAHGANLLEGDPSMSVREATRRRDFTVNSLALDPLTGEIIDEHGGLADLRARVLRATDAGLFGDDPLRAVRAMQLCGRFELTVDAATVALCRSVDLTGLPAERIGDEWLKLLVRSPRPSLGLATALEVGVIERLHPELARLTVTPQDPVWHPEGDVWVHTLLVVDAARTIVGGMPGLPGEAWPEVLLAALCHDLGKPETTRVRADGRIVSPGHAQAGVAPAASFLAALRAPKELTARVLRLVRHHLWPSQAQPITDRSVRRLARDLAPASIELLVAVARADRLGRGAASGQPARGAELLQRAAQLGVEREATRPVVMGRHLQALGLTPGPDYARILRLAHEAQDAGCFTDAAGGLAYLEDAGLVPRRG